MAHRFFSTSLVAEEEEPSINLTPLIDVVFVILITFILIAPLLEIDRVDLAQGRAHPTDSLPPSQSSIVITLCEDDTILWNQQPVTLAQLIVQLHQARQQFSHAIPQLYPDRKAHFGSYQAIKNATEEAGFGEMQVILHTG